MHAVTQDQQRTPTTVEEWRYVATLAAAARMIHDAQLYGFVSGGPALDPDRIDELLEQAAELGIVPVVVDVEQIALNLVVELAADTAPPAVAA